MGRIADKGLEYFSMATTWQTEVKLVKAKYGALIAVGFLTELWASIYRENYYRTWNEETELLFADEIKQDVAWVHEVIEYCFDKKIFDRAIFEAHGVLTGHGIQKRYFKIARDSLGRTGLDYIEGITYPDYMPKNNLPGKADFPGGNRDNLPGKADNLPGYDHKGKEGKGIKGNLKKGEEGEEPPALVDNSNPEDLEAALFAFALARVRSRKKQPGDPEAMARKIMYEDDVVADFQKSLGQGEAPSMATFLAPEPGPCPKCGVERKTNRYAGVTRCLGCGSTWTYDRDWKTWSEDTEKLVPTSTGDDFEDTG